MLLLMSYATVHCLSFTTVIKHYFIMERGIKKKKDKENSLQTFIEDGSRKECSNKEGKKEKCCNHFYSEPPSFLR